MRRSRANPTTSRTCMYFTFPGVAIVSSIDLNDTSKSSILVAREEAHAEADSSDVTRQLYVGIPMSRSE